jgi:hypothetical protein
MPSRLLASFHQIEADVVDVAAFDPVSSRPTGLA